MGEVDRLPVEPSSFVGRAAELAAVGDALASARLLTLVGPGGCGKTRLAIRVCREQEGRWADGVHWAGLEHEPDGRQIAHRVAEALGLVLPGGSDTVPGLVQALRGRSLLLALDNCEHVLDEAAGFASAVLTQCPGVKILATSRATLGAGGERVWRVPPLALADALELFVERSATGDTSAARRICDRLDRLPLALELAAGWADTLSPAQIAEALAGSYALLEGGARTAAFRQRTLEGSMRWSHDLLEEDERVLFRRLAVFEPGFGVESACTVAALPAERALRALRGLVDKSLVVADTAGPVARYRMLGVVRAFALARLRDAGEEDAVRARHLKAQLALVEEARPLLETDRDAWRARIGEDYANLRSALGWGLRRADPGPARCLAAELAWLWHLESRRAEGLRLLREAAERGRGERTALQARVLLAQALVADSGGPGPESHAAARAARELAVETGAEAAARLAGLLAALGLLESDLEAAAAEAARLRGEALEAGDGFVADAAAALVGLVHLQRDEHGDAIMQLRAALEGLLRRGDRGVASSALGWLAQATAGSGDLKQAEDLAERSVATAEPLRDFHRIGLARGILAEVRTARGRLDAAAEALRPIDRLRAESGETGGSTYVPGWERRKALLALALGRADEAVALCRAEAAWRGEASGHLEPETRLVLARAQRESGDEAGAARTLDVLEESPLAAAMPRVRAGILEQRALLLAAADDPGAVALHHEALRIRTGHELVLDLITGLGHLADLARRRGAAETAAVLTGAVQRAREDAGAEPAPPGGDPALRAALDRGRALGLREAVAYARRARGPRRRPGSGWASLTPTERSVVELAVQGLSNPQIAARLLMSRGTVKTHLAHVYAKLHVANRTELARLSTDRF
ncbi:helix-turn-helix transcriptional regulator [Actinomadura rudentiformis]|uniref:LuxR family transcriptional regulator n=1 Tax=Actinomadura rudentiformis TaxID=359158 RepID=A0A6H9Z5W4_9ACTN|nr:LuxR C-terminal-related transcriptional regulator [Actinomadura rudentiformis]KAB2349033.1 LuxR family transcriptional regulator [Actinomadura rudentiformis]